MAACSEWPSRSLAEEARLLPRWGEAQAARARKFAGLAQKRSGEGWLAQSYASSDDARESSGAAAQAYGGASWEARRHGAERRDTSAGGCALGRRGGARLG